MEKEYVLKHDFGYGKEFEQKKLNRLSLRNIKDLEIYVQDAIENSVMSLNSENLNEKYFLKKEEVKIELINDNIVEKQKNIEIIFTSVI